MSRILFTTVVAAKEFPIVVGFDRRLGDCFVSVGDVNMDDEDYEDERFDAILTAVAQGLSRNLCPADCKAILEKAGVVAPKGVYELLESHVATNAGNVIVRFDAEGVRTVLLDEDAKSSVTEAVCG
jgi:hypothetical protein